MLRTLRTLVAGANARAEEQVRDHYAIDLIEQKIRDAKTSLKAAKLTLAGLIQRQRSEDRLISALDTRIGEMTVRTRAAIEAGSDDLAESAANAIADMENERAIRQDTLSRLETKVTRLQTSVEAAQRRIVDLNQGAIAAKAVRREQNAQVRLKSTLSGQASAAEAEDLIASVLNSDDPSEEADILREIDDNLSHDALERRMAEAGFGPNAKTTGADVLTRLKSNT